jgi:glycerophosphoryl diester phosphodiesterase
LRASCAGFGQAQYGVLSAVLRHFHGDITQPNFGYITLLISRRLMLNFVDSAARDSSDVAHTPRRSAHLIAHRGGGWLAPENTLAAFQLAADIGFTAFECDVKLSADGVPFLLHDDQLDRTTQATGRASWQPWSQLARVAMQAQMQARVQAPMPAGGALRPVAGARTADAADAPILAIPGGPHAAAVGIPSLADLAALLAALMRKRRAAPNFLIPLGGSDANAADLGAPSGLKAAEAAEAATSHAVAQSLWLNLEIKPDADASAALQSDWGARIASHAADLWARAAQPPCLSSFSIPALQGALRNAPELPRAWLCERLPEHWLGIAQALQVSALHLDAAACNPALVETVHSAGLALRLYTVNDPAAMTRWLKLGVDGLFTDALQEAAALPRLAPRSRMATPESATQTRTTTP